MTAHRFHAATRKGLFTIEHGISGWHIARAHFLGGNCTLAMHDPRDGSLLAALDHGRFGVKDPRAPRGGGDSWKTCRSTCRRFTRSVRAGIAPAPALR